MDIPVNFETLFDAKSARSVRITIEDGFKTEIERLESLGKINSATKHKYALQVLNGYKPTTMALEAIDLDYLKGLELYLRQRENKDNSIATRFAIFKAIYNKAVKEGKVAVKQNPFSVVPSRQFMGKNTQTGYRQRRHPTINRPRNCRGTYDGISTPCQRFIPILLFHGRDELWRYCTIAL